MMEFLRQGSVLFISQRPVESPNKVTDDDHGDGKAQNGSVPQFQESTIKINSCHYFESCINYFDSDQNKLLEIYGEQLGHKYGLTPWR